MFRIPVSHLVKKKKLYRLNNTNINGYSKLALCHTLNKINIKLYDFIKIIYYETLYILFSLCILLDANCIPE